MISMPNSYFRYKKNLIVYEFYEAFFWLKFFSQVCTLILFRLEGILITFLVLSYKNKHSLIKTEFLIMVSTVLLIS